MNKSEIVHHRPLRQLRQLFKELRLTGWTTALCVVFVLTLAACSAQPDQASANDVSAIPALEESQSPDQLLTFFTTDNTQQSITFYIASSEANCEGYIAMQYVHNSDSGEITMGSVCWDGRGTTELQNLGFEVQIEDGAGGHSVSITASDSKWQHLIERELPEASQ